MTPTAVIRAADWAIGGQNETIRDGLEDWDYRLKMAAHRYRGGTIREYLTRYRHHATPTFWTNRDDPGRRAAFRREIRRCYTGMWRRGGVPSVPPLAGRAVSDEVPFASAVHPPAGRRRVFMLVPWFNLGGADRFNLNLVEQLTRHDCEVTLCATTDGPHPWLPAFTQHTPDYFWLPSFLWPEDYPRFLRYLIAARQTDVVLISNSMLAYSLLPYLRAHCPGVAFVDYNHMATEWLQGGFVRVGLNASAGWTSTSSARSRSKPGWWRAGGARRVEVCYTNIDTQVWDAARYDRAAIRRQWQLPDETPILIFPARIEPQKRPRLLVEILRGLRSVHPDFLCLIVGDGPQRAWLAAAVARQGLKQQARLLGAIDPGRMPELMAACDVLVLPSQDEGISLAIYEAMALGVVPVVADVGGQRELVTPGTGYLIPHGPTEVDDYVQTLAKLLASPELRRAVGRAGRERLSAAFTIEALEDRMQTLFETAQHLAGAEPREAISLSAAHGLAVQVVDDLSFERLQERLRGSEPVLATAATGAWPATGGPSSTRSSGGCSSQPTFGRCTRASNPSSLSPIGPTAC